MSELEEYYKADELSLALVISGMREIERHGLADFSLRRVASACGVSCAAPYRHFKSKGDLIFAIIAYVNTQWALLEEEIVKSFEGDTRRCLTELSVANIRFFSANPNFRHIMLMDSSELDLRQKEELSKSYTLTRTLIRRFCEENQKTEEEEQRIAFLLRTSVLGAAHMLGVGELENSDSTLNTIKASILDILS